MTEKKSERIADVMEFSLQNVIIPRVSSAVAATLAVRNLVGSLQNPTTKAPFAKINDTHHTALRNIAELFNNIPKVAEQQSTNRHNGRRREVEM